MVSGGGRERREEHHHVGFVAGGLPGLGAGVPAGGCAGPASGDAGRGGPLHGGSPAGDHGVHAQRRRWGHHAAGAWSSGVRRGHWLQHAWRAQLHLRDVAQRAERGAGVRQGAHDRVRHPPGQHPGLRAGGRRRRLALDLPLPALRRRAHVRRRVSAAPVRAVAGAAGHAGRGAVVTSRRVSRGAPRADGGRYRDTGGRGAWIAGRCTVELPSAA
mmetsp:Transcript_2950/g.11958  ORF Transcript_2950/g.11958 Transcript_2950/m.11958 type:complete len:215 (-) Transcript_2950:966-1610(-)